MAWALGIVTYLWLAGRLEGLGLSGVPSERVKKSAHT